MTRSDGPAPVKAPRRAPRPWALAAAAAAILPALSGCAEVLLVSNSLGAVHALPSNTPRWVVIHQQSFAYPADLVYGLLEQTVAQNGREIVERDAPARVLRVSYPFSWLKNNWGGTLRITCAPDGSATTVTLQGDGRDSDARVRPIGDELLHGLDEALRRSARTL